MTPSALKAFQIICFSVLQEWRNTMSWLLNMFNKWSVPRDRTPNGTWLRLEHPSATGGAEASLWTSKYGPHGPLCGREQDQAPWGITWGVKGYLRWVRESGLLLSSQWHALPSFKHANDTYIVFGSSPEKKDCVETSVGQFAAIQCMTIMTR